MPIDEIQRDSQKKGLLNELQRKSEKGEKRRAKAKGHMTEEAARSTVRREGREQRRVKKRKRGIKWFRGDYG